jgi:VWFA-related protein
VGAHNAPIPVWLLRVRHSNHMSRSLSCALLAVVLLQFRAGVEVAIVNVTVIDERGKPVPGLTPSDFEATVANRRSVVLAAEYLSATPLSSAPATAGQASSRSEAPIAQRTFVLIFDDLSFRPGPARELAQPFEDLLSVIGATEPVGLMTTSGLGPGVAPTTDRGQLIAGLRSLQGRREDVTAPFVIGIDEAFGAETRSGNAEMVRRECAILPGAGSCGHAVLAAARREALLAGRRTEEQMKKIRDAIAVLRNLSEPRVLVLLSGGIAADPRHGLSDHARILSEEAASSGVQLYGLTSSADGADVRDLSPERRAMRVSEQQFLTRGVQTMAHAAGGESFVMIGQPRRFVERIALETSAIYRLAVELPSSQLQQQFLTVRVKVTRRGVTVRTKPVTLRRESSAKNY